MTKYKKKTFCCKICISLDFHKKSGSEGYREKNKIICFFDNLAGALLVRLECVMDKSEVTARDHKRRVSKIEYD